MGELKACPFCGGEDVVLLPPTCRPECTYDAADRLFPVCYCRNCGARVPGRDEDYKGTTAIAAWNRRALPEGERESDEELFGVAKRTLEWLEDFTHKFDAQQIKKDLHRVLSSHPPTPQSGANDV